MRSIISHIAGVVVAFSFAVSILFFAWFNSPYQIPEAYNTKWSALFICAIIFFLVLFLPRKTCAGSKFKYLLWVVSALIAFPFAVTRLIFGTNDLSAILIFFRDNQIDDMVVIGGDSFSIPIGFSLVVFIIMMLCSLYLFARKRHFDIVALVIACLFVILSPITLYVKEALIENKLQTAFEPATEMSLKITARPSEQRNLIVIYLESLERTYGQLDETQKAYGAIKKIADDSIESVNMHQTFGTTYTIAGIVASQCGVPLLSPGLSNIFFRKGIKQSMDTFLPSLTCLGDVLSDDGYHMSYLNGASLNRFSKRGFFKTHGFTTLLGSDEVAPEIMSGRTNPFGMNDALLFEFIYDEFDRLNAQPDPFSINALTISTHGPDAFLDGDCPTDNNAKSQLPTAIACTAQHLEKLISYVRSKPSTRPTDFVILSDHLALPNTLSKKLRSKSDDRRNLFFIHTAQDTKTIQRASTPLDIYPTILEHLGYELVGGQANLGRSLFTEHEN